MSNYGSLEKLVLEGMKGGKKRKKESGWMKNRKKKQKKHKKNRRVGKKGGRKDGRKSIWSGACVNNSFSCSSLNLTKNCFIKFKFFVLSI